MLVTFKSSATESVQMFRDSAVELLRLMGASGHIPGGLNPEDVPAALQRLEAAVERIKAETHETPARPADNEDWATDEDDPDAKKAPPVAITARAVPLLSVLRRAAAANKELTWE
jgi:hypothetical protein